MANNKQLPDWKDAPEWAMWRVIDNYGAAWYHQEKPILKEHNWKLTGSMCFAGYADPTNWRESLERRPENTAPTPEELTQMCGPDYELWEYLHDELGVIALDGQIGDIIEIVRRIEQKRKEQQ